MGAILGVLLCEFPNDVAGERPQVVLGAPRTQHAGDVFEVAEHGDVSLAIQQIGAGLECIEPRAVRLVLFNPQASV